MIFLWSSQISLVTLCKGNNTDYENSFFFLSSFEWPVAIVVNDNDDV